MRHQLGDLRFAGFAVHGGGGLLNRVTGAVEFGAMRRAQRPCKPCSLPSSSLPVNSLGTTVKAQRVPVKPAFFEKLRNSIAQSRAPSIS